LKYGRLIVDSGLPVFTTTLTISLAGRGVEVGLLR